MHQTNTTQQIEELRVLYAKEFGKIITEDEAQEMITRLTSLYLIIYRPLPVEKANDNSHP